MRSAERDALSKRLRAAGVQRAVRERMLVEIEDHFDELVAEYLAEGRSESTAFELAAERIGPPEAIASAAGAYDDLGCWSRRYPRTALVVYPLACAAVLPAVPLISGVRHAALIGRWLSCLLAGGIVTASMFLFLKLAIGA